MTEPATDADEPQPNWRLKSVFLEQAIQYHAAAWILTSSSPSLIAGNLAHHAAELYLKAVLVDTVSERDMKKRLGHDLVAIWEQYKDVVKTEDGELEGFLSALNDFEDVRYPQGLLKQSTAIVYGPPSGSDAGGSGPRVLNLHLEMLDRLAAETTQRLGRGVLPSREWVGDTIIRLTHDAGGRLPGFEEAAATSC